MVIFSIVLVAGTAILDARSQAPESNSGLFSVEVIKEGNGNTISFANGEYDAATGANEGMELKISSNVIIRLDKESSIKLEQNRDASQIGTNIIFQKGRIWVNSINSNKQTWILTNSLRVSAEPGVFDAKYIAGDFELGAFRHSAEINFLEQKLVLPEGRAIKIAESKIQNLGETISKLRYSKLIKEFPFFGIERNGEWIGQNAAADEQFSSDYRQRAVRRIRTQGSKLPLNDDVLLDLRTVGNKALIALTFADAKKNKKMADLVFDYFDSGLYAALVGKNDVAARRFEEFSQAVTESFSDASNRQYMEEALQTRLDFLAFLEPRDNLYSAKSALREISLRSGISKLHDSLNAILDTAIKSDAESSQQVATLLRRYGLQVSSALRSAGPAEKEAVFFESVLLSDFLDSNPGFLREEFLKISEIFERAYLNFIQSREEEEDQRQFFIGEKLRKIRVLAELISSGGVIFQDGRKAILLLVSQVEGLKPAFPGTAVLSYYEEQLAQLNELLAFLRSSSANNVHNDFSESFAQFRGSAEEMRAVNELLSRSSGGTQISAFRREELAAVISKDFAETGLSDVSILLPEAEGVSRVTIKRANFEGKSLIGVYDTSRKVFSDIDFDGERITNPIRLENLKRFLLVKLGRETLPNGVLSESLTEAPSQQSMLERAAQAALLRELSQAAIRVDERYLGFENLNEGIVHVRMAHVGDGASAKVFSFDFVQRGSQVNNIKVQTVAGEIPINESFDLRELPVKVEQIYQRALFEKQREEEVQRFSREGTVRDLGTGSN